MHYDSGSYNERDMVTRCTHLKFVNDFKENLYSMFF